MPKATRFSELRAKMPPEDRAEARRLADQDLNELKSRPLGDSGRQASPKAYSCRKKPCNA
jgi:hypothetical protein